VTPFDDERNHRHVIAQAEGVISVRRGVDITEAAVILRAEAAASERSVSRVATNIVQPLSAGGPEVRDLGDH
jgi:AmiR/NasT family two-component response regulator